MPRVSLLHKMIRFGICAWALSSAQLAVSQMTSVKTEDKPIDTNEGFIETVHQTTLWDTAFGFMVQSANDKHVHKSLNKVRDAQNADTRQQYGHLFPDVDFGNDATANQVNDEFKSELVVSAANNAINSIHFLKRLTKQFKFSFNLFEIGEEEQEATAPQKISLAEGKRLREQKRTAKAKDGFGLAATGEEAVYENHSDDNNWRQMGDLEASLAPNVGRDEVAGQDDGKKKKKKSRFNFAITQGRGFYTLNAPVGGNADNKLTHAFRVPLFSSVKVGRDFNEKGQPTSTGLFNLFASDRQKKFEPQLDVTYDHQKEAYGTKCSAGDSKHNWSVESYFVSKIELSDKDFGNDSAEYNMGYEYKF